MAADPALDLVSLAIRHLEDVPNIARRASLLEAAAGLCRQHQAENLGEALDRTAADLRKAEDSQLHLAELFSLI